MEFNPILAYGFLSLCLWGGIWWKTRAVGILGWISPISIYAIGILLFYIIPSIYWQWSPWNQRLPNYFDGLPNVLIGAIVLGLPFYFLLFLGKKKNKTRSIFYYGIQNYGIKLWLLIIPIVAGFGWRIYLITIGWQSRVARESPEILGSESLALISHNLPYWAPAFYFALIALGSRGQKKIGIYFWLFDGLLQIYTLQRHAILFYLLRSAVFWRLMDKRISKKTWIFLAFLVAFVIAIIGKTNVLAYEKVDSSKHFLSVSEAAEVIETTFYNYILVKGDDKVSLFRRTLDETMFRFYEARSAAAVMMNVPETIQYYYGQTFLHIFYSWTPRFLWPDKPNMGEIHLVTTKVMPHDQGVNPAGTIAELYMNFGYWTVFLGGIISVWICRWNERILIKPGIFQHAMICVYPLMGEWYIGASYNMTQRLSEGLRCLLVLWVFYFFLKWSKRGVVPWKS